MKVSSVLFGTSGTRVPKADRNGGLSEFAYVPSQNSKDTSITPANFKRLIFIFAAFISGAMLAILHKSGKRGL